MDDGEVHADHCSAGIAELLSDAAAADREGKRVLYGDFVTLLGQLDKRQFRENEDIVREGDAPDGYLLLLSGRAAVLKAQPDGTTTVLSTLSAGDAFGA